ncbi:hypothetical protein D5018_03715 [Parashewanella curva]|uniref:Uncharacterized protein n=1 Tax=Parashewanella curva TaxID=2338552 RepID=A0A3L8Q1J8_9GAMM|nr:hypothetical protein [Parashewanella curva]RLV60959.1 hypothetical protein D5018_03715 [Parashewanella curva]
MKIKLNRKLGKTKAKIFALTSLSIKNMTWLFLGLLVGTQLMMAGVELLVWGETFQHWGDSISFIVIASAYFYYSNALGEFLLDLHLNAEVEY